MTPLIVLSIPSGAPRAASANATDRNQSSAACGLRLQRFDSFDDAAQLREAWDALVERVGGDLFSTFDWCAIWWKHFGRGRRLELHAAWSGSDLVAVLPMFRETIGWGPVGLRVVRVVGCDHCVTTCNVAIEAQWTEQTAQLLVEAIESGGPWDLLQFGELPGYAENASMLVEALRKCPQVGKVLFDDNAYPHNVFDVPGDYDAFLAGLSTKERRNVRRDERQLQQKDGAAQLEPRDDEIRRAFDDLVAQHQGQWTARGRLGHFGDWLGVEDFHRETASSLAARGRLALVEVRAEGRLLASEYAGRFGRRVHWIIGGRSAEVSSRIGFCALLRSAIRDGATLIDALPGSYDYKRRLGARTLGVKTITVRPRGGRGRLRLAIVRGGTRLLSLAYHRLWFWHLAPWLRMKFPRLRLPMLRAGLWRRFLRARFLVAGRHDSTAESASSGDDQ